MLFYPHHLVESSMKVEEEVVHRLTFLSVGSIVAKEDLFFLVMWCVMCDGDDHTVVSACI